MRNGVLRYDRQRTEQTLKENFYDRQTRITCSGRTRISARSGPRGSALVISSGAAHRGLYFISGERDPEAFWRGREGTLSWRCGTCCSRDRYNGCLLYKSQKVDQGVRKSDQGIQKGDQDIQKLTDDAVKISVYTEYNLTDKSKAVLALIKEQPDITQREIAAQLG